MSLLERRAKKGIEIPKLRPDSPGYFTDPAAPDADFEPFRESSDFGDIKIKSDGTFLFSDAYPIVKLADIDFHEKLGSGVQGTVYRCHHLPSGKEFAVKSIHVEDKATLQKTVDEIHSLRILKHENVVNLFSAFYQKGKIHILMDLVHGASIGDYIKFSPSIPEVPLGRICYQVIQGLMYLRRCHYIHRDLKPSNIMLSLDGVVKIADFGLARQLRSTKDFTTSIIGTTCYMSPERIRSEEYGIKSDIWSLGVILFQCALGRFPFGGQKAGFWDVNFESQEDFSVTLPEGYSDSLTALITRCLQIDETKRASIEELAADPWVRRFETEGREELTAWIRNAEELRQRDLDLQRSSKSSIIG